MEWRMKSLRCCGDRREANMGRFAARHPWLALAAAMTGLPILVIGAVSLVTWLIIVPVAGFMGWL